MHMTKEEIRALLKLEGPELWLRISKRNKNSGLWQARIGFRDRNYPEDKIDIEICSDWGKSDHRAAYNAYQKYLEFRKVRPYK